MTRVYVGTCSWADHTNFYPPELPKNQQIIYYSQSFSVVEIDSSFYRLMPARNYQLWAERTPPGFVFDVTDKEPCETAYDIGRPFGQGALDVERCKRVGGMTDPVCQIQESVFQPAGI